MGGYGSRRALCGRRNAEQFRWAERNYGIFSRCGIFNGCGDGLRARLKNERVDFPPTMDFSDSWRSLWPIEAVPHPPNLLSGDESICFGPLLFRGSPSYRVILASSSLALHIPPVSPPSIPYDIQSFFRCPATGSFLSTSDQYNLATDLITSLASTADPIGPLSCNNLHALPCRDGSSILLFFPTGDNSDEIGFLCLHFNGENLKPNVGIGIDGDIFKQKSGFKHPRHRIRNMVAIPVQADHSLVNSNVITQGFLIATTLYSVNWFRVETRVSSGGNMSHFLLPLANQSFSSCVVDACWSPHFSEESAVLLESGVLYWFNLITKRSGTSNVSLGRNEDPGRWLGCKFGGQPWIMLVASSTTVVLVDLRGKRINEEPKVLARVKLPDFLGMVPVAKVNDTFQAFCGVDYSSFHFTAVTERLLLLFDTREPLVPVLTWLHGVDHPTYVSMFRLSEFRPSEEFKWASESGFVILVGSFLKNDFKLIFFGFKDKGAFGSSFYAWELPSSLSLSGRQWHSADELVREIMLEEKLPCQELLLRKEGIAGFYILPNNLMKSRVEPNCFVLIRLMLSGKLEIQEFYASYDSLSGKPICEGYGMREAEDFTSFNLHEGGSISSKFFFFKLSCLYMHMAGNLSTMLTNLYLELNHKAKKHIPSCDDLEKLMSSNVQSSGISISNFISDVSMPINVFEVASRRVLTTLKPNILSLAFTKAEELLTDHAKTSFLPLEFPERLPHQQFTPFCVNIPASRSEHLVSKSLTAEAIVGPILPLPILLVLQQLDMEKMKESLDDDLLNTERNGALDNGFPGTSIADGCDFRKWLASQELRDDKEFLAYRPKLRDCKSVFKDTSSTTPPNIEEQTQMDHVLEKNPALENIPNDENFRTFICGASSKMIIPDHEHEVGNSVKFDFIPFNLDFESWDVTLQPTEQKLLESLMSQASSWLEKNKAYQDFCTSSKFQKSV
ncbi:hypothetical protein KSP40_PGU019557 [Platanthera guangdongensis]|uniref:Uncharacterized protein n=1 Tax=Platanthera guangdongensis TaxID=2320717 RepID=A0ABR2MZI6_9ASPA